MGETETVPEEVDTGRRSPLKLAIVAVVVLGAIAAAWFLVLAPSGDGEPEEPPAPEFSDEGGEPIVVDAGTTVSVGGDERGYAMLTYSVRPAVDADVDAVQLEFAHMRSEVQRVLLGYSADELLSPDGVDALEADIELVADVLWPDGEIVDVYLENLVVQ